MDISDDHLTVLQTLDWPASGRLYPFDRLVVSQLARSGDLATADRELHSHYGVPVLDAVH